MTPTSARKAGWANRCTPPPNGDGPRDPSFVVRVIPLSFVQGVLSGAISMIAIGALTSFTRRWRMSAFDPLRKFGSEFSMAGVDPQQTFRWIALHPGN
jgi:hypothetical protein